MFGWLNLRSIHVFIVTKTDEHGETVDGGKVKTMNDSQINGNEALRTRSRRIASHSKTSAASDSFDHDVDPYRKVRKLSRLCI
jgi:hypothetical protein